MDTISKIRSFFDFQKRAGEAYPLNLAVARLPLKKRLAWHSIEVRDALVAVPKSNGNKDTTHFPEGFFQNF